MPVRSGLFHSHGANSIPLLEDLLLGGVLLDEIRDPRRRIGLLVGFAKTVQDVAGGEGSDGNVETALLLRISFISLSSHYGRDCRIRKQNIRQHPRLPARPGDGLRGNRTVAAAGSAAYAAPGPLIAWQGTLCQMEGEEQLAAVVEVMTPSFCAGRRR